jgi:hypothetical protein
VRETLDISGVTLYLYEQVSSLEIPNNVVANVKAGLTATGRASEWGLTDRPYKRGRIAASEISPVTVELLNEDGKVIGRQNASPRADGREVTFTAVKADDVTTKLSIQIAGIGGEQVQTASKNRHVSIMPLNEYNPYKIGDRGPGGGIVFYDRGFHGVQWRYLEAAPKGSEIDLIWQHAVASCDSLNIGGYNDLRYDDWHLPDKDELNLMYRTLKQKGLGEFSDSWYWSSSQVNNRDVWGQDFSDGKQGLYARNRRGYVRAVRAF